MEAAQPTTPPPAKKRLGIGEVIGEAFSTYGQNFGALFGSALAVFVVVGLVSGILFSVGGLLLGLLAVAVGVAGRTLYTGFVVELVQDMRDGKRDHTVGDLFEAAIPFILPLVGFGILFGIGVAIGFVLLIVPGLILLTFWSVGAPAIVIEGIGPIDAFRRSWELVRGNAWPVFGVIVLTALIVFAIQAVLAAIASPIGDGEVSTWIASIVSGALTAPIYALVATILYFELAGDTGGSAAIPSAPASPPAAAGAPPPPPPPPAG